MANAVDAHPHARKHLERFDVNVACARIVGVLNDAVGQADDRGGFLLKVRVVDILHILAKGVVKGADDILEALAPGLLLVVLKLVVDLAREGEQDHHLHLGLLLRQRRRVEVEGVGNGDYEPLAHDAHGQHLVLLTERAGQLFKGLVADNERAGVDGVKLARAGFCDEDLELGDAVVLGEKLLDGVARHVVGAVDQ